MSVETKHVDIWEQRISGKADEGSEFRQTTLTISELMNPLGSGPTVPMLRIQGQWMRKLGWNPGDLVSVEATPNSIEIFRIDGIEDPPGYTEEQ